MLVDIQERAMPEDAQTWGDSASVGSLAPVFDLDRLLDQMTPETFPDDADFGAPVGQEVW